LNKQQGVAGVVGAAIATLVMAAVACSNTGQKSAPELTEDNLTSGTNTKAIQMPEGFRNVAFTCHGTVGVYVTSRGIFKTGSADAPSLPSGIAVLADDPNCGARR
jgi:hypothetical protein